MVLKPLPLSVIQDRFYIELDRLVQAPLSVVWNWEVFTIRVLLIHCMIRIFSWSMKQCPLLGRCPLLGVSVNRESTVHAKQMTQVMKRAQH